MRTLLKKANIRLTPIIILVPLIILIMIMNSPCPAQESEDEETYSISLVQTAEVDRAIHEVDGKKVLTESYTIKEGEYIWQLLRERGLLEKRNFMEILSALKKLNSNLSNLDLVHPGEKIIIPLVISPLGTDQTIAEASPSATVPLETIQDIQNYTVRRGDSIIRIVNKLYDIPEEELYDEYLDQLKKMNPSISDLNNIYPGQKIRLPIYSPKAVRLPIKKASTLSETELKKQKEDLKEIGRQLGEIFSLIGEEWTQTGNHFIPLKPSGQIDIDADSYPIIDLRNGKRVIVDLYNDLPKKMAGLITSSWDNYRVVHLEGGESLREAVDKILPLCDYQKVYGINDPLILGGDIPMRITADWIIRTAPGIDSENESTVMITLCSNQDDRTPDSIKTFLGDFGIKVFDYPLLDDTIPLTGNKASIIDHGDDLPSLIETLLNLTGHAFTRNAEVPIYQKEGADFSLTIKADFMFNINGKDHIIDLSGLGPDIITLLQEHQFLVLSLSNETSSSVIVTRSLEFLGVSFDSNPHPFLAANRDESKNVRLMIPGIIFQDNKDNTILATHLKLSPAITNFLTVEGYSILLLPLS